MDAVCRLCCSDKFVNNHIFDDKNGWYNKMGLLPVKIDKNDELPQKICDRCSCKVSEFYEFCNETKAVQNKLQSLIKQEGKKNITLDLIQEKFKPKLPPKITEQNDTQYQIQIKVESPKQIKQEATDSDETFPYSDDSEDETLLTLRAKKQEKDENDDVKMNCVKKKSETGELVEDWSMIFKQLPNESYNLEEDTNVRVKQEVKDEVEVEFAGVPNINDKYRCCICMQFCRFKKLLLSHYKTHEKEIPPANLPVPLIPEQDPSCSGLRCGRCKKSIKKDNWTKHWQNHWKRDHRPYRCSVCHKSFTTSQQILTHGLTHNRKDDSQSKKQMRFVCDFCPEEFMYMRCLQAHRTNVHPESAAKPVTLRCWKCSREFAHLNSLRRHFMTHTGERNFLCNVCGKAMSSGDHLKLHINIHTGYKPNVCSTCGKAFVKKSNLKLHERVHSGEKPYVCSHCGKAFSQRSTLVIHERYHSGARPYVCALCGRGFVAKGLLSMHLKTTCI